MPIKNQTSQKTAKREVNWQVVYDRIAAAKLALETSGQVSMQERERVWKERAIQFARVPKEDKTSEIVHLVIIRMGREFCAFDVDFTCHCSSGRSNAFATSMASMVLPDPGGPQKIIEVNWSVSIIFRIMPFFPVKFSWPTNSSNFFGLILSAKGFCGSIKQFYPEEIPKFLRNDYYVVLSAGWASAAACRRGFMS